MVFAQNHDQVGNRPEGDRLAPWSAIDQLRLAAALLLLSPGVPLLFMGEEYGETAPFPYFVDHGDPALIEAVRAGRRREYARAPTPADRSTRRTRRRSPRPSSTGRSAGTTEHAASCVQLHRDLIVLREQPSRPCAVRPASRRRPTPRPRVVTLHPQPRTGRPWSRCST